MKLSQSIIKSIGRLLIGVLLFAQLAVASYACPGLMSSASLTDMGASGSVANLAVDMPPGCDETDPAAPNLCVAHCQQGQQSADTAATPLVNTGIPTLLYPMPLEPQGALGLGRSFAAPDAHLEAAPEPPHAILHCVFRL